MDKGKEFAREVSNTLAYKHGAKRTIITSRNPQANSMIERCHKTLHNMICSTQIKDKWDSDSFLGFKGVLAACRKAMNSTMHTTACATPTQLVFGHDAILNASFQADWQFIEERKQKLIIQNNKHENTKQTPHTCTPNTTASNDGVVGTLIPALSPRRSTQSPATHQLQQTLRNNANEQVLRYDPASPTTSNNSGNATSAFSAFGANNRPITVETVQENSDDGNGWPEGDELAGNTADNNVQVKLSNRFLELLIERGS